MHLPYLRLPVSMIPIQRSVLLCRTAIQLIIQQMDSTPDEDSEEYTDPISMPEGTTIFKAVLVNGKGRLSGVTTRNYERTE